MAIRIWQVLAESNLGEAVTPERHWRQALWNPLDWSDKQRLLGQWLATLSAQLGFSEWSPPPGPNGILVPPSFLLSSGPGLRRIVEIGCGNGAFTLGMAMLFPNVEIVGIDADARKIEEAQGTVGYCDNIRFVHGHAPVMDDIPCDRIVYNHCLADAGQLSRFNKMVYKTSRWLVDEGDFWVRESWPGLLARPALLRMLAPYIGKKRPIETLIAQDLSAMGHPLGEACMGQGVFGLSCELFVRAFPLGSSLPEALPEGRPQAPFPGRAVSVSEQSNDTLVDFLFSRAFV
jgi:SAM-dependent methyltransferase